MKFLHRRCRREIRSLVAELDLLHRMYDRQVADYNHLYNVTYNRLKVAPSNVMRGHPSWNVQ